LLAYVKRDHDAVPALRMMELSKAEITKRAEKLIYGFHSKAGEGARPPQSSEGRNLSIDIIDGESLIGGGSAPSAVLPTALIALASSSLSANQLATRMRACNPPVIARVEEGRILLDLRTVFPAQDEVLRQILGQIAA